MLNIKLTSTLVHKRDQKLYSTPNLKPNYGLFSPRTRAINTYNKLVDTDLLCDSDNYL